MSKATIISWSTGGEEVCASAARISTSRGSAQELFALARDNPRNRPLIKKVLASGHRSVIEHAVFSIALQNVSVYAEQFFIEFRLASFTVKSRRYVDFSGLGYYIPPELEGRALADYRRYMDALFAAYQALLEEEVPKEDARFLLPYAFCSNFYCTLNARELLHVLRAIRCGRGRHIPELRELGRQLTEQLADLFPGVLPEWGRDAEDGPDGEASAPRFQDAPVWIGADEAGAVRLLAAPADPAGLLAAACRTGAPDGRGPDLEALLRSGRPRELEQLSYTFAVSDVTLAGVTHLVRHRMQSVIVPPVQSVDHSRFILPDTVRSRPAALEKYRAALAEANSAARAMCRDPVLARYSYYFAVSGNVMDVMTTMNARELKLLIQLRACNRAQWEIRHIALALLRQLRDSCPDLFDRFGPGCYLYGDCPEGPMSCGQSEAVKARFAGRL